MDVFYAHRIFSKEVTPAKAEALGKRIAIVSMLASAILAALKITIGLITRSTALTSDGFESAGDVFASGIVYIGFHLASKPPDEDHPYGHGRFETLAGLLVGILLTTTGVGICLKSLDRINEVHPIPALFALWPLVFSIATKSVLATVKMRIGRRISSDSLQADSWNDALDILSGTVALVAVSLAIWNPDRFSKADHIGGFIVGLLVVYLGIRVMRETVLSLLDTMPEGHLMDEIRAAALSVPGAMGVEKCFARKTGLRYHVDLHLEVDPDLSVRDSHEIATQVRIAIKEGLPWVADVLVHVEPYAPATINS
jgi:cation diffusion facilitator family transporter